MKKLISLLVAIGLLFTFSPIAVATAGQGPYSGEFSAWSKFLANGSQIKFYAKYPQLGQKIQFLVQDSSGVYKELAWLRVSDKDLNADGSYKKLQNDIYFIRTLDLKPGKNRVRIAVDGKVIWGTKTYVIKPPQPEPEPSAEELLPEPEAGAEAPPPIFGGGGGGGSAPAPEPVVGSLALSDVSECKLIETENITGAGPKGFPHSSYIPTADVLRIALIPVDFSNAVGDPSLIAGYALEGAKVEAWAQHFARGKMSYQVQWNASAWIRAPKEAQWYGMVPEKGGQMLQSRTAALQDLVSASDSLYDFTAVDLIYFIFPLEAEATYGASMYDQQREFTSDEGTFTTSVYGEMGGSYGNPNPRSVWDHLVHEILHYQGLIGHGPENGSGGFISTDQWGPAKAITMWEQFLVGWVDTDDVACITRESITGTQGITLNPTDNPASGPEAVMIRINSEELIVIEYREVGPYSSWKTGLTAYRVDVNGSQYRCDSCNQLESEALNWWGFIRQGGSEIITDVVHQGVRIRSLGGGRVQLSVG